MEYTSRQIPRHRNLAILASIALVVGVLAIVPSRAVEFRGLTQIVGLGDTNHVTPAALDSAAASVGGANVSRIVGQDRFQSAASASQAFDPGGTVIVTTGDVFADALVASPLALSLQAPLLLTEPDDLPEATADALIRLSASQVIIVGGYGAVSLNTEDKIADVSVGTVRRVDGPNRWATAAKMSNVTHPLGANRVYVSNGGEWTDALPGAMAAAALNAPLLFVRHDDITDESRAALTRLGPQEIVIIGNEASVAASVEDDLDEIAPLVRRIGDETRWETAASIAEDTWPDGAEMAFVATGSTFEDALMVAPLMARRANLRQQSFASDALTPAEAAPEFAQVIGTGNQVTDSRPDIPGGPLLLADENGNLPDRAIAVLGELDANEEASGGVGGGGDGDVGGDDDCTGALCDDDTVGGGGDCTGTNCGNVCTGSNCEGGPTVPELPTTPTGPTTPSSPTTPTANGTAHNDAFTVGEDSGSTILDVLSNDLDPEGDTFRVISVTDPDGGSVTMNPGGSSVSYVPDLNACNNGLPTDDFTYTITGGSTATVAVSVTCVNDAPIAVDDAASVGDDNTANTIDVMVNDSDVEGDAFTVALVSQPDNGTAGIGPAGANVTYTPDVGYCNDGTTTDDFVYQLNPGAATATVSVSVSCDGSPPTATDDAYTIVEDTASNFTVRSNDSDPEGDPITVTAVTNPPNGTAAVAGDSLSVNYTPDLNYCGADSFDYTLNGGNTATVTVTITCVDDDPIAVDDAYTRAESSPQSDLEVLDNDSDPEGQAFTIQSFTQPSNGSVVAGTGNTFLRYTPTNGYCNSDSGTPDTFSYTITGGDEADVSLTVTCTDAPAVAEDDAATVTEDDPATAIDVRANDSDPDPGDEVSITSIPTAPANGTVAITGGGTGLTYAPVLNYCNSPGGSADTFTYEVNGGDTAQVSMTVTCVDDPAVANDDPGQGLENQYIIDQDDPIADFTVLDNDTDVDGGPAFRVTDVGTTGNGDTQVGTNGQFIRYQPDPGFCGSDQFNYTITGGAQAQVNMTVRCAAGSPTAVNDTPTVQEDPPSPVQINVLANDQNLEPGTVITSADSSSAQGGTVVVAGDNLSVTYQPQADYCNTGGAKDTFSYTISGGSQAEVQVRVSCQPDAPRATNDSETISEDPGSPQTLSVLANDSDPDGDTFQISQITTAPVNGTVQIVNNSQQVTYLPTQHYCNTQTGGTPDTFEYELNEGARATVSVTVTCVDDPAVTQDDAETIEEDKTEATIISVLANDSDIDSTMALQSVGSASQGTAVRNGNIVEYTPTANACNTHDGGSPDTFAYTLSDGQTGTIRITITCATDPPTAVADGVAGQAEWSLTEDQVSREFNLTVNDTDPDLPYGDDLTINSITNAPTEGTLAVNSDTVVFGTNGEFEHLSPGEQSTVTFNYDVNDTDGTVSANQALVTITVTGVNDAPRAKTDSTNVAENDTVTILALSNDEEDDTSDQLTLAITNDPQGTENTVDAPGRTGNNTAIEYTADGLICNGVTVASNQTVTINYTATDLHGGSSSSSVTVTVACNANPLD